MSVDGRLEGFPPEVERYYELAAMLPHDAILTGSGTMVAAASDAGIDLAQDDAAGPAGDLVAGVSKPMLVVVDSRGRLTRFDWLRATGLWSDLLVVGSKRTPKAHHALLRTAGVDLKVIGGNRVDLEAALRYLREERDVEEVRVDAGTGLNGALLEAGLLDELSVLLAPYLVGHGRCFLDGLTGGSAQQLELTSSELQPDGHVWLRYSVTHG